MSKEIRALREKRAEILSGLQVISDLAAKESRMLTDEEKIKWDKGISESNALDNEIGRLEELLGIGTRRNKAGENATGNGVRLVDSDGKEVRTYRHGEKIAESRGDGVTLGQDLRESVFRALNTGSSVLPAGVSSELIDLLRDASVMSAAGVQTIPMHEKTMSLIKQLTDPTVSWVGEESAIAEGAPTFGEVELVAKKLAGLVKISWEMLQDNPIALEQRLPEMLAEALAAEVDRVILEGAGTVDEPAGIKGRVSSLAVDGKITWDDMIDSLEVTDAGNAGDPSAMVFHSRDARALAKLKGTDGHYLRRPEDLAATALLKTNKIAINGGASADESTAYIGRFSDVVWGQRTQIVIQRLSERYADTGQVAFLVWLRGDVAVLRNNTICELTGIKPNVAPAKVEAGRSSRDEVENEVKKGKERAVRVSSLA